MFDTEVDAAPKSVVVTSRNNRDALARSAFENASLGTSKDPLPESLSFVEVATKGLNGADRRPRGSTDAMIVGTSIP